MRSCFGMLMTLLILFGVIGTGAMIWYLSSSTEVTRKPVLVSPR